MAEITPLLYLAKTQVLFFLVIQFAQETGLKAVYNFGEITTAIDKA